MKFLKMVGLAALVATALMAVAGVGSASASVLCKTKTNPCTSKWTKGTALEFALKAGTSALWREKSGTTLKTCTNATIKGSISVEGNASEAVKLSVPGSGFVWSSCTTSTETLKGGEIEIKNITGTENGTVILKGFEFATKFILGSCSYGMGVSGTDLGTLTASATGDAVIDGNALLFNANGICCPEVVWIEEFTLISPKETPLYVEPS
ncbi:MAG TPA: hypothetical protein VFN18_08585 [Solirubrobacterales bacterium]|nr:hypothetical protein [Solirubrobacterales bacterium]